MMTSTNAMRITFISILLIISTSVFALEKGEPAPSLNGSEIRELEQMKLDQFLGKTVLVDFWATWCIPCRQSFPHLNELQTELKDDFVVLSVNASDTREDITHFVKRYPVNFPILINVSNSQIQKYNIEGLPTSYLIDKNGRLLKQFVGFKPSYLTEIKTIVLAQNKYRVNHE